MLLLTSQTGIVVLLETATIQKTMMRHKFILLLSTLACGLPLSAQAHPLGTQDFHPNCDIRQLKLSKEQFAQLRDLRTAYKQAIDKTAALERRMERPRRQQIQALLAAPSFNEQNAVRYVNTRYAPSQQFAVEELAIQHKLYQLLNPEQRKMWLNTCVR
ncbi:MAG: Spy/CpxP family protein refolding chaperone [Neisseria sp.]|nr:Spy/CpxP family protein refolding chaperone [Neisseria sp.]